MLHLAYNANDKEINMIPIKLQIKNFLSYGNEIQVIDFSSYKLICLSGRNGHGKSALLDAITWAVWGNARKIAGAVKADEGLLRLGQDHMMVIFDFMFDNELYRIRREFSLNYGKHQAVLEFGILNPENNTINALTDKTIRATQRIIEKTLGLDYESFVNSSFLRQGHANEFSKKSSKERKEILANILGLNKYENIRKLAMEKIKQGNSEKKMLNALQEKISQELEQEKKIKEQLATVNKELITLTDQNSKLIKEQANITKQQNVLTEKQKQHDMLKFQYNQIEEKEEKQQHNLHNIFNQWRSIHAQLLNNINHEQLEKEKKIIAEQINKFQIQLHENLQNKEQLLKTKEQIHLIEQDHNKKYSLLIHEKQIILERLNTEKTNKNQHYSELQKQLEQYTTEEQSCSKELKTLEKQHAKEAGKQQKITFIEEQFSKRKAYYQKFVAQGNWLNNELRNLEQKKQLVHNDDDPSCPLCEQNLSASRKRFLKGKFVYSENVIRHQFNRISIIIAKLKTLLMKQHKELEYYKNQQQIHTKREATISELNKRQIKTNEIIKETHKLIHDVQKASTILNKKIETEKNILEKIIKENTNSLTNNNKYIEFKKKLLGYEATIKNSSYNAQKHRHAQKQLEVIEKQLTQTNKLKEEYANQEQRKKEIRKLCIKLKEYKKNKAELAFKLKKYADLAKQEQDLNNSIIQFQSKIKELTDKKEAFLQQKGSLESQQEKLKQVKVEQKQNQKKITQIDQTIADYQAISTATGKDGIQALLIEDAIPEIEQEANNLLSKLTNNQAQIFIESLRDLKSGGTKETLDIKISDPIGIRPYELFSGGEAFRIDFALRIAISKLLAHRAGTALQTLIIDEGFGSQDEQGLAHIMDAIYKIQDDFSKIIIVSHLSTMKDQFPVHFVIEKLANGSHVTVIEHG